MAWIADRGGLAGASSEWGCVSVDYHGWRGRGCDGQGAWAHGFWHLVVGAVPGSLGLASLYPQGILPARHPSGSSSVTQVGVSIPSLRSCMWRGPGCCTSGFVIS